MSVAVGDFNHDGKMDVAIANNGSLDGYFQGSQQQLSTNTYMATMFFSDGTLW